MRSRIALSVVTLVSLVGLVAPSPAGADRDHEPREKRTKYLVYWDQNEEENMLRMPSGRQSQLIAPWDPNGQLCVLPDHSGRFVVGYNPTVPAQHNPGSLKPLKHPPVGEALYTRRGEFTGVTLHVPGPFDGGDIPPDNAGGSLEAGTAEYNSNGTMTGCAVDRRANVFASDLGTAQGAFPPPDSGRIIEWFAPSYDSFCIVAGPTAGGVGPHHVDGTGGLRQPGDLAFDPKTGDLLVPEAGSATGGLGGRVSRFLRSSLPRSAASCGSDGVYPRSSLHTTTFVQGDASFLPFPVSIARDPTCACWAVSSVIGDPSIVWLRDDGTRIGRSIPGQDLVHLGQDPNGVSPFGIAFAPDGTLYVVDIHIKCDAPLVGCGPTDGGGRELRYTFRRGGTKGPEVLAQGYNFPTSVTVCARHGHSCPERHDHRT